MSTNFNDPFKPQTQEPIQNSSFTTNFEIIQRKLKEVQKNSYYVEPLLFSLPGKTLYPENRQRVLIEPLKGKHEKLMTLNIEPLTLIDNMLLIILDTVKYEDFTPIDLSILSMQDFLAIQFLQKLISYQNDMFLGEIACESCKNKFNVSLNAQFIEIDDFKDPQDNFETVLPESGLKIKYTYLKAKDFKEVISMFYKQSNLKENEKLNQLHLLALGILNIDDLFLVKEEISKVLDELSVNDFKIIKEKIENTFNFGIKPFITRNCPVCGTSNQIMLSNYTGENQILPFRLGF